MAIHMDLLQDIGSAVRRLAGQRGFTLASLLTLALGIGANTAMFSIVYGLLLRPLPYPDAEGLVRVSESMGGSGGQMLSNRSMPVLEDAGSFEQLAAYRESSVEWASPEGTVTLRGAAVSPALFPLLRAVPRLGRLFADGEAREGADRVVLLSHRAWTNHFVADPDIVGTPLDLAGDPHTIVGVLGEGFYFPNPDGEFWTPLVVPPFTPPTLGGGPGQQGRMVVMTAFNALGRLAPGVSAEQAAVEARTLLQSSAGAMFGLPAGGTPRSGRGLDVDARGGAVAGRDGRRVPAGPSGLGRGDGAGAADRLYQCRGAAARAGGDAPAGAGGVRRARRQPLAARPPAPDRERGAGRGRRRARVGLGGAGVACGAGARSRRYRAARRGGHGCTTRKLGILPLGVLGEP